MKGFLNILVSLLLFSSVSYAQLNNYTNAEKIITAVPFILISPDARTSSMGNAGVAVPINSNSSGENVAKTAFLDENSGFSITYIPWLNTLVNDRKLMYVTGFHKLSKRSTLTSSLKYLSYGQFDLTDNGLIDRGTVKPNEYVADIGISRNFGPAFSIGTNVKFIHSNLYSVEGTNVQVQGGNAFAVDISSFHRIDISSVSKPMSLGLSLNILNMGPKMSYYYNSEKKFFLPTMLKIGSSLAIGEEEDSQFILALDLNKLLVPSSQKLSSDNETLIEPSVLTGMINSFSDSKERFKGEIDELGVSIGAEYAYQRKIFFRAGYNYQNIQKGDGSFISMGLGLKYKMIGFDLSYLRGNPQQTFLSNTLRFTIGYSFL